MSWSSVTPSLVAAVLAATVASGAAGYAAGTRVTSAQIADNTIQSRDVKNGDLTGADVRNGSLSRNELDRDCPGGSMKAFGGYVSLAPLSPTPYNAAVVRCNERGGRLPTLQELTWLSGQPGFRFGSPDPTVTNRYEFTGSTTTSIPITPIAIDRSGGVISNAVALVFASHCIVG